MTATDVLIVDDNDLNLEIASVVLDAAGYRVAVARNAEAALTLFGASPPRVVLLDIQMPGTDGMKLLELLQADPRSSDTRFVAFTAYAMKGDETKLKAAGFHGYIAKPVDVAQLAAQVGAHMAPPER